MSAAPQESVSKSDTWAVVPKRVLLGALGLDAFLALMYSVTIGLSVTPTHKPITFLFDLNGEGNVQAWWQGSQLLLIGLAFFALSLWFFQSDERVGPLRRLFFVSGLAFTYFSADEIGQIHENLSRLLQSWHALYMVEIRFLAAIGHKQHRLTGGSIWIPLFAIIGVALIWWLWPQFKLAWKLWRREILLLIVGFGVLVFAATVIESMGDLIPAGARTLRMVEVGVEETLESIGSSIVLYSVVSVLGKAGSRLLPGAASQAATAASPDTPDVSAR